MFLEFSCHEIRVCLGNLFLYLECIINMAVCTWASIFQYLQTIIELSRYKDSQINFLLLLGLIKLFTKHRERKPSMVYL